MRRQTYGVRGAAARRGIGGALLALLALAPGPARAARPESTITVRGRITDESGEGVPAQMVRLLKSRTIVKLGGLRSLDQSVEEKRATTDPLGFFEIECPADPEFPYYYLRFYDPKGFDAVKYRLPEDREITKRVRDGRPVQVSVSLKFQSDWPKVKTLIDQYSPGSQVGQVLRSLGLPSSRSPEGSGRELWTYGRAGVAYLIEGSKVIETRTLPGGPKNAGDDSGKKDEPADAVRVDGP